MHDFLLRNKKEDTGILKKAGNYTTLESIDLFCMDKKRHFLKYVYIEESQSNSFGTASVNYDSI